MSKPVNISTFAAVKTFCLTLKTLKGMKKLMYLALAFIAIATGFTACRQTNIKSNTLSEKRANTKIDDILFGIEYDDYDFDSCVIYFDQYHCTETGGKCSEIYLGNYVGRNLDYNINNNACAIIKVNRCTKKNQHRFASIGVIGCWSDFSFSFADSGKYGNVYKILPCRTEDGINENGVYVGVNIIPQPENSIKNTKFVPNSTDKVIAYEGNPGGRWYNTMYLTRVVLDNARTVDSAISYIKKLNWYFPVGYASKDNKICVFHWLIADKNKSCVLEFNPNNPSDVYTNYCPDQNKSTNDCFGAIMTNFTNQKFRNKEWDDVGIGYERWDTLYTYSKDKYNTTNDVLTLMKRVWYSHSYLNNCTSNDHNGFWFTELSNNTNHSETLYHLSYDTSLSEEIVERIEKYKNMWFDTTKWYKDNSELWYTVHTSIYDLKNLKGFVVPHEGRRHSPDPSFVPDETLYEFNFSSSFAKPLQLAPKKMIDEH